MPGLRHIRLINASVDGDTPITEEPVDERAHFMRCPYCDEFFDMRELSEVTLHYDFSLTMSSDGTVTIWPILGHPPPGLRNNPREIAWLEEFHGAKSEPGVIPR